MTQISLKSEEMPRTRRIALRPALPADATQLKQWRSEPSVRRHQPLGAASLVQLRSELANQKVSELYRGRGEKFQWIICCDERPVGWITLVVTNWDHGLAEIGYALTTEHQGRGLMPVALQQLLAGVLLDTNLHRIEARCAVDNIASQKVLEGLGFEREGLLRDYFVLGGRRVDNYLFAILRSDFLPRSKSGEKVLGS